MNVIKNVYNVEDISKEDPKRTPPKTFGKYDYEYPNIPDRVSDYIFGGFRKTSQDFNNGL